MKKNLKMRLEIKKGMLREWEGKEHEAREKMMSAKSKQTVKKWSRELQVCGMNTRELERDIENLKREKEGMGMDVKIKLDEIRNYLQYDGELCDDRGNKILEIDIDGKTGEPIVETKNRSFVILDEYINRLYKRMELMKREIGISGNVTRGVITVNGRIVDYKRFIDSDEFQSSSEGDKEMKEKADKLEEKAQEQIRVETYLVKREIERLEKIKIVLDWYESDAFTGKMYDMSLYDNNAEQIDEFEVY